MLLGGNSFCSCQYRAWFVPRAQQLLQAFQTQKKGVVCGLKSVHAKKAVSWRGKPINKQLCRQLITSLVSGDAAGERDEQCVLGCRWLREDGCNLLVKPPVAAGWGARALREGARTGGGTGGRWGNLCRRRSQVQRWSRGKQCEKRAGQITSRGRGYAGTWRLT